MPSQSSKPKGKSDWIWHEADQNWYRQYKGSDGQMHYEWAVGDETSTSHDETPRHSHSSSVDRITQGLSSLSHESYDTQPEESSYTLNSGGKSKGKSKGKGKGKGKGVQQEYADERSGSYAHAKSYPEQGALDASNEEIGQFPGNISTHHYGREAFPGSFGGSSTNSASYDNASTSNSLESTTDYSQDDPNVFQAVSGYNRYAYSGTGQSSAMGAAYGFEDYQPEEGEATPTAPESGGRQEIFDELEVRGRLDPRYIVQPSSAFQPGAIFMVYWAEPYGSGKDDAVSSKRSYENKLGETFYYGIRRFVVIANDQGHATVVPIMTYGRKACKKKGVKPEKHGIIYQDGEKARLLDKEPPLGFPSVRAVLTEGEKLAKESRINYSKLMSVEHNFRVLFIGNIRHEDLENVNDAVNACWEAKVHHKKKHRR